LEDIVPAHAGWLISQRNAIPAKILLAMQLLFVKHSCYISVE